MEKPLILDFKTTRQEENCPVLYEYDPAYSMNMIIVDGIKKPFIDLKIADMETATNTKVAREKDDCSLYELGTKTEVRRERGDIGTALMELATKTFVNRESDDERPTHYQ